MNAQTNQLLECLRYKREHGKIVYTIPSIHPGRVSEIRRKSYLGLPIFYPGFSSSLINPFKDPTSLLLGLLEVFVPFIPSCYGEVCLFCNRMFMLWRYLDKPDFVIHKFPKTIFRIQFNVRNNLIFWGCKPRPYWARVGDGYTVGIKNERSTNLLLFFAMWSSGAFFLCPMELWSNATFAPQTHGETDISPKKKKM